MGEKGDLILQKFYHYFRSKNAEYKPGWEKDIYPTQEFLLTSIENSEIYVGEINGHIFLFDCFADHT